MACSYLGSGLRTGSEVGFEFEDAHVEQRTCLSIAEDLTMELP